MIGRILLVLVLFLAIPATVFGQACEKSGVNVVCGSTGELFLKGATINLGGGVVKANGTARSSTATAPSLVTPDATYNPATLATQLNTTITEVLSIRNSLLAHKIIVTPTATPTATNTP